jgi:hypothetical protein
MVVWRGGRDPDLGYLALMTRRPGPSMTLVANAYPRDDFPELPLFNFVQIS